MSEAPQTFQPFGDFLAELEDGEVRAELSRALAEVVAGLRDGRPSARLLLTLDFTLLPADVVEVRADVATKTPRRPRPRSTFAITIDDTLSKHNPRQAALTLPDAHRRGRKSRISAGNALA
jgi:hypothetical protein